MNRPLPCRLKFPFRFHRTIEQVDREQERSRNYMCARRKARREDRADLASV